MAKRFDLIVRTTDQTDNTVSETLQLKAGAISFDAPQVSFEFPPIIAVQTGGVVAPHWGGASSRGFAFCKVTPTPTTNGTGRFLVQYYYQSGLYPSLPARRFDQTFTGSAATLAEDLNKLQKAEVDVSTGGGVTDTGFATSADVSGLRKALVISSEPPQTGGDFGAGSSDGEPLFQLDAFDEVLAIYNHDLITDTLETLRRLQVAEDSNGNPVDSWATGSYIFFHPYHYVPLYENNTGGSLDAEATMAVMEEGAQYPLTGSMTVTSPIVSGQFTRFLTEISSGVDPVGIRFAGDDTWYIISGVQSNSGLIIHDYGDNPSFTNVQAEVNMITVGSGTITILTALEGCENWDVAFDPEYQDQDEVGNLSVVPFTADIVEVAAGGAVSGTASYDWTVQYTMADGNIGTSGFLNQGNTLNVDFAQFTPIDVTVQVSGAGQVGCVHSKSTGFITLLAGAFAGVWDQTPTTFSLGGAGANQNLTTQMAWTRQGTGAAGIYFHNHLFHYHAKESLLGDGWRPNTDSIMRFPKGAIDTWSSQGSVVVYLPKGTPGAPLFSDNPRLIYCSYSGKSSTGAFDQLTGVQVIAAGSYSIKYNYLYNMTIGRAGYVGTLQPSNGVFAYVMTPMHWPHTYVTQKFSDGTIQVADSDILKGRVSTRNKILIWGDDQTSLPISVNFTHFSSASNLISTDSLPTNVGNAGAIVSLEAWQSNFGTLGEIQETLVTEFRYNRLVQSFFVVDNIQHTGGAQEIPSTISFGESVSIKCWDMTAFDIRDRATPAWARVPPIGKLLFENSTGIHIVFDYSGYTVAGLQDREVTFQNCTVNQSLSHPDLATGFSFGRNYIGYNYKELDLSPATVIHTEEGDQENVWLTLRNPGLYQDRLSCADMFVAQIHGSFVETQTLGNLGVPDVGITGVGAERFRAGFPTNGIPQIDPIYRFRADDNYSPSIPPASGACVHDLCMVTVKTDPDAKPKDMQIRSIGTGMGIYTSEGFKEVRAVKRRKADEAYSLVTEEDDLLIATGEHPVCIDLANEKYCLMEALEPGMQVITLEGPRTVKSIELVATGDRYFCDLILDTPHNFFANGVLVHNKVGSPVTS
jgi:hypothetical protein